MGRRRELGIGNVMSAVFFLLLAVVLAGAGCTAQYVRQRTPTSVESGIDGFRREMDALSGARRRGAGDDRPDLPDEG
jgi:hypothetical protein